MEIPAIDKVRAVPEGNYQPQFKMEIIPVSKVKCFRVGGVFTYLLTYFEIFNHLNSTRKLH